MSSVASLAFFIYECTVTTTVLALVGMTLFNLLRFKRLTPPSSEAVSTPLAPSTHPPIAPSPDPPIPPSLSICVPARNEERCIEACITSLLHQDYPHVDIVVLDDTSTDRTLLILKELANSCESGKLHVIHGSPLPVDWVGKSWACHQLAEHARGEYVLFTDADTTHAPAMASAAVDFMEANGLDCMSLIPYEECGTFWEHVVIPMVHVLFFAYLPTSVVTSNRRVSVAAANGQFLLFRRTAYDAIGGHASVRGSLVEDVFLAREIKRHGLRMALVNGVDLVRCRMYMSAREVFEGFSKNFFPGMSYHFPTMIVFQVHLLTAWVLPVFTLIGGMLADQPWLIACSLLQVAGGSLIRLMIAASFRMPAYHGLLQPLAGLAAAVIGVNSVRWAWSRTGAQWKGRAYQRSTT